MLRLSLILFLFCSFATLAHAEDKETGAADVHRIAAVVNDDLISMLEVEDRMRLVVATTGLHDSREVRAKLGPQIVRALIDEKLQMQAAHAGSVTVSKEEISAAIATLEKQRGKQPGSLMSYLASKGVPASTFLSQVEAQLAWSKLISRKLASGVTVSEEEVAREVERLRKQGESQREEVLISSVLLPVDKPERESSVQKLAEKLISEIQAGANFEAVASQLSAQGGGRTTKTWIELSQLDPALASAIRAQKGTGLVGPVRTASGYHILNVEDRHDAPATVDAEALFKEIVMRLRSDAEMKEVDVLMDIAKSVARHPGTCAEKNVAGIENFDDLDFKVNYVRTRLSQMSPEVRPLAAGLDLEQVSEPFAAPDGIHLLMMCEKVALPSAHQPDLKKIRAQLLEEKYQMEAMRSLRNLRREAFVDVRL